MSQKHVFVVTIHPRRMGNGQEQVLNALFAFFFNVPGEAAPERVRDLTAGYW